VGRRLGLLALWAVFAAAAVGVGFAAAGLVGDPFSDPGDEAVSLVEAGAGSPSAPTSPSAPAAPATPGATGAPGSSGSPGAAAPPARDDVVRSLTTRAGTVSASCAQGLVTLSAAPAVGWRVDDLDGGPTREGRVRLEQGSGGSGEVEVRVACRDGVPRFAVDDRPDDDNRGPGGGDDDGGSGSGSGSDSDSGSGSGGPGPG
jgi:hypothetical protein